MSMNTNPFRHAKSLPVYPEPPTQVLLLLAVLVHGGVMVYLSAQGLNVLLFGILVPSLVASALGAYLFYAQHNFPSAKLKSRAEWSHVDAALRSSSFMRIRLHHLTCGCQRLVRQLTRAW